LIQRKIKLSENALIGELYASNCEFGKDVNQILYLKSFAKLLCELIKILEGVLLLGVLKLREDETLGGLFKNL